MEFHGRDISPELVEKAKACTTPEELLALARDEGMELTDDELNGIAGGAGSPWDCMVDGLQA